MAKHGLKWIHPIQCKTCWASTISQINWKLLMATDKIKKHPIIPFPGIVASYHLRLGKAWSHLPLNEWWVFAYLSSSHILPAYGLSPVHLEATFEHLETTVWIRATNPSGSTAIYTRLQDTILGIGNSKEANLQEMYLPSLIPKASHSGVWSVAQLSAFLVNHTEALMQVFHRNHTLRNTALEAFCFFSFFCFEKLDSCI